MSTFITAEPADYLILKDGYWYRPNKRGYTKDITAAGRYTRSDAEREARVEPWHMKAVPLSDFRVPSLEVQAYAAHLRALGFTVIAPKDMVA